MNRVFRIIWSTALRTWVVASELATAKRRAVGGAALALAPAVLAALPQIAAAQAWTGGTSNDWTVGSNWSTGTAPTTGNVTINSDQPNATVIGVSGATTATAGLLLMGTTAGTSSLTIQNGSTLTSTATGGNIVGQSSLTGANATVTVTGTGSRWTSAGGLVLGNGSGSTGTLNVANGATVQIANAFNVAQGGTGGSGVLNVAGGGTLTTGNATMWRTNGNSTVNVSGAGSQWNVTGTLTVGNGVTSASSGNSVLTVDGGGRVAATGPIHIGGANVGARGVGSVNVSGPASQLSSAGALNIGQWGAGTLNVSNGALASADTVTVGANAPGSGTLNLSSGGTLASRALTGGVGVMRQVNIDDGTLRATADNAAFVTGFSGTELNIAAGGLTLDTNGFDVTVASPFSGAGALTKSGFGTAVFTGNHTYAGNTIIQQGTLQLGDGGTSGGLGPGTVTVAAPTSALTIDRSDAFDFANTISGPGGLVQAGSGTTRLLSTSNRVGWARIDAGTLQVDGALTTPTLGINGDSALVVNGSVQGTGGVAMTLAGDAGNATIDIGYDGLLRANGDLGDGADAAIVAGTLDSGTGTLSLGTGDDTLTLRDGAVLAGTGVDGGTAGDDALVLDVAGVSTFDAARTMGFERLVKRNAGTATFTGAQSFASGTSIEAGTLTISGALTTPTIELADGTALNVLAGSVQSGGGGAITLAGSSGDNTVTVATGASLIASGDLGDGNDAIDVTGTLSTGGGVLALGAGDDTVNFNGGDASGVTALDGGAGHDVVGFSGMQMNGAPSLTGWERVELRNGTALTLANALELGGGTLAIDGTSTLLANAGGAIGGDVENAGTIDLGMHRMAVGGRYASNGGTVRIGVTPTQAGGLDVGGDVVGDTRVEFVGDGSDLSKAGPVLVVSSPNDDAATAGRFVPTDVEGGKVRVGGSVTPWSFDQNADRNWYLTPESSQLLPEVAGYGALPGLGAALSQHATSMAQQRLGDIRNIGRPACDQGVRDASSGGAGEGVVEDCHGAWVAVTANELELGANPGFAVSGDDVGMYAGIDGDLERPNRTFRAGGYIGYTRGVYWSSGANSSGLAGMSQARIELDTPTVGMYASHLWNGGSFLDLSLSGSRPTAQLRTPGGFTQRIVGNYLTFDARAGHAFALESGWTLEPQVELIASAVSWQDLVDEADRELRIDDAVVGTARAALRIEKAFTTSAGSRVRPWAKFAVQNIVGEQDSALDVRQTGSTATPQAFPTHDLGTSATLDVGVEAAVGRNVNVFGQLSASHELDGTDYEQRSATVGVNVRW